MIGDIKIRKASSTDIKGIEELVRQYWEPSVNYLTELDKENTIFLVAEKQQGTSNISTMVGVAIMWMREWNRTGYVPELAVDQKHRRTGIGKLLVSELSNNAKKRNARAIIVETQPSNKEAMDFYLSNGFRLCGYNDRYYTNEPRSSKDIAIFFSLDL